MATPPSPRQLRYLRELAVRTGTTFTPPLTARAASRAIDELKNRPVSHWHERNADRVSVAERRGAHNATDVRGDEVDGFGAGVRWAGRR